MSTSVGIMMMLFFAAFSAMAMENYKLVSGNRAKKIIVNGYKFVIVLSIIGAVFIAVLSFYD